MKRKKKKVAMYFGCKCATLFSEWLKDKNGEMGYWRYCPICGTKFIITVITEK